MMGLQDDVGKYFIFTAIMVVAINTGASLLILVGSVSKTMATGNMIATVVLILFSVFNT